MRRLIGLVFLLTAVALPGHTAAQVDVQGATSLSVAGSGVVGGDFQNLTNILGLNKFIAGGLELGGFVIATISKSSTSSETDVSGFFFGKLRYNFIGQSTTVPFLEVGAGTQLDEPTFGERPQLVQGGGGVKWFLNERVSFDLSGTLQGQIVDGSIESSDGVFVTYGLTVYF